MKKGKFSVLLSIVYLVLFFAVTQESFSQCTNQTPTGATSQSFCKNDNKKISDLVVQATSIAWFDSATGGNQLNPTSLLLNGKTYYADDISGGSCSTPRLAITVAIYGNYPSGVDIFVGKCKSDNPTIATLSATGSNIQWYSAQFGGNLLPSNLPLTNGQTYWVQQTENGCTSNRLPTTVTVVDPQPPIVAPIQSFCSPPTPTVGNLSATGINISWYDSENSEIPLDPNVPLENNKQYWASQNSFPCESTERVSTTVFIDTTPNAGTSNNFNVCEKDAVKTDLFNLLGGSPDISGSWSGPSNLSGGYLGAFEPGINIEGVYTYTVSSTLNICPDAAANITVTIQKTLPPTTNQTIQTFCEIDKPTISNLSVSGNNIQWYSSETSTSPLDSTELLMDGEDYWAAQKDPQTNCESVTRVMVTVTIISVQPPTVSETNQTFCEIDTPTIANLSANGTGIKWYASETDTAAIDPTELLINGSTYWASQTNTNNTCESANRVAVNVTIISVQPPTVSETNQTFCEIDAPSVANLTANGTDIEWYDSETATTPLDSTVLLIDGLSYWASNKNSPSGCESISRVIVTVTIKNVPPPEISITNQTFCEVDKPTVANLAANGNTIEWYASETATAPLNSSELLIDGATYWATQKDALTNCESATRIAVNVSIISVPPPTITETNQTFCEVDNPTVLNLSANGNNLQWYSSETSTTPLDPSELLIDGLTYWAAQKEQNGCESASRVVVNVTIISVPPPTLTETNQIFCKLDNPTVSNLFVNDSNIVWYASEISNIPLSPSELLIDGYAYWAAQKDALTNCESTSRIVVNVTLTETLPVNTIIKNLQFCIDENATVFNLNAVENNLQWYSNNSFETPIASDELLINGQTYWAKISNTTSNCEGITLYQVTISILNLQAPTTEKSNQAFCIDENATIFNLQATGENIKWYVSESSTIPLNSSDILENGKTYWATQSDNITGCESVSRLPITVSINAKIPPIKLEKIETYCEIEKPTIASLSPKNTVWYASENSTVALNPNDILINGEDYWSTNIDTSTGCENSVTTVITVIINVVTPPTTASVNQSFCEIDNPTISNLNINGNIIKWYSSETSIIALSNSEFLINGSAYWATNTTNGCESAKRIKVNVTINSTQAPTTLQENQSFCINNAATIANLIANGTNIQWYDTELSTTPLNTTDLLIDGEDYWATQTNITTGCISKNRLMVKAHILNLQKPTTININQQFCKADKPTIANLQVNENAIWFDSETATIPLNSTTILVNGKEYWAAQINTVVNCESIERTKITVTLTDVEEAIIVNTNQTFCAADLPTIAHLEVSGNQIIWYATETSISPLEMNELLVDGEDYWAVQTNASNGCESSTRKVVNIALTPNSTPQLMEYGNEFCKISNPTLLNLNENVLPQINGSVTWYDNFPNGTLLNLSEALIDGETYYAVETKNGCTSTNPLAVTVNLNKCETYDIEIFDGFSPTGNGINDTFTIKNLRTLYPNFKVEFYNRWGSLVYTSTSSNSDWNGKNNGTGELAPAGIYYFIIYFNKDNKKPIQKRLYLSR
ncbi:gliding motility-associated C-terminal domain-containing protein [Lutibacter sp.]|uniref:Ig-like domain-containing protein n=1 Tax=Lutibacter sp. TaxID=1925666 RepID=UPI001A2561CE|nr:gliding motility-associated C-terminal domain-containing protein [Lutibacter sp.]MBI9040594.1 gliding motility-associated C-terminal domain-containing protein [Lutibacter sp.]